jgi:hypothetical protein
LGFEIWDLRFLIYELPIANLELRITIFDFFCVAVVNCATVNPRSSASYFALAREQARFRASCGVYHQSTNPANEPKNQPD